MKISQPKKEEIIKGGGYYFITTRYQSWCNSFKVKFCAYTTEELLENHMEALGYNMFVSENEAQKCLKDIQQVYEKYKDK